MTENISITDIVARLDRIESDLYGRIRAAEGKIASAEVAVHTSISDMKVKIAGKIEQHTTAVMSSIETLGEAIKQKLVKPIAAVESPIADAECGCWKCKDRETVEPPTWPADFVNGAKPKGEAVVHIEVTHDPEARS